jgi:hypothetical protein
VTPLGRAAAIGALVVLSACGAKRIPLPSGPGTPFPEFAPAFDDAVRECQAVNAITATLGLSGRSGDTKLRGRIDAGLAAPGRIRLEGFPPVIYGSKPFFILVASGADATLLLPRDDLVLRGAAPGAIVDALAGVPLGPDELRALLAGCGLAGDPPTGARAYDGGWVALERGDTTTYLRQLEGRWRVVAAVRPEMTVQYSDFSGGRPGTVNVRTGGAERAGSTDMTLRLSDVDVGGPFEDGVFRLDVPTTAAPITLDELRRNGPLGEKR